MIGMACGIVAIGPPVGVIAQAALADCAGNRMSESIADTLPQRIIYARPRD